MAVILSSAAVCFLIVLSFVLGVFCASYGKINLKREKPAEEEKDETKLPFEVQFQNLMNYKGGKDEQ